MKKILVGLSVSFLLWTYPLLAQTSSQTITLKDGTVLKGQLTGVNGDTYSVQTPTMGAVKIKSSNISSITSGEMAPNFSQPTAPSTDMPSLGGMSGGQMQQLQSVSQNLLTDPEISSAVQEIMNDKEAMTLVQNPQMLTQMLASNPQQMQNDPSIQKFLQNPKVKNVMDKIMQKMSASPSMFQGILPPASSSGN